MYIIVFNTTEHSIVHDSNGCVIEPHGYAVVDENNPLLSYHLADGRLRVIDPHAINDKRSSEVAIMMKREWERLNQLNKAVESEPTPAKIRPVKKHK